MLAMQCAESVALCRCYQSLGTSGQCIVDMLRTVSQFGGDVVFRVRERSREAGSEALRAEHRKGERDHRTLRPSVTRGGDQRTVSGSVDGRRGQWLHQHHKRESRRRVALPVSLRVPLRIGVSARVREPGRRRRGQDESGVGRDSGRTATVICRRIARHQSFQFRANQFRQKSSHVQGEEQDLLYLQCDQ